MFLLVNFYDAPWFCDVIFSDECIWHNQVYILRRFSINIISVCKHQITSSMYKFSFIFHLSVQISLFSINFAFKKSIITTTSRNENRIVIRGSKSEWGFRMTNPRLSRKFIARLLGRSYVALHKKTWVPFQLRASNCRNLTFKCVILFQVCWKWWK